MVHLLKDPHIQAVIPCSTFGVLMKMPWQRSLCTRPPWVKYSHRQCRAIWTRTVVHHTIWSSTAGHSTEVPQSPTNLSRQTVDTLKKASPCSIDISFAREKVLNSPSCPLRRYAGLKFQTISTGSCFFKIACLGLVHVYRRKSGRSVSRTNRKAGNHYINAPRNFIVQINLEGGRYRTYNFPFLASRSLCPSSIALRAATVSPHAPVTTEKVI